MKRPTEINATRRPFQGKAFFKIRASNQLQGIPPSDPVAHDFIAARDRLFLVKIEEALIARRHIGRMKIITEIKGKAIEAQWVEPRGVLQTVFDEPAPGVVRHVTLGAGGVIIKRGEARVAIPLAELFALAEKHDENIAAPKMPTPILADKKPLARRAQ